MQGISQNRIRTPRFDVMDFQFPAANTAILAGEIISDQSVVPQGFIFRALKCLVPEWRGTINPSWVSGSDKMGIARGNTSCFSDSYPDFLLFLYGMLSPLQCCGDSLIRLFSCFGSHHRRRPSGHGKLGNLLTHIGSFCRIVNQVTISHFARVTAKLQTPSPIGAATLYAD